MNNVLLVEEVVCVEVPCCGTELVLQECNFPHGIYRSDDEVPEPHIKKHRLRVHEFRGGPFREGVRIAFAPAVEDALGVPLQAMSDQIHALEQAVQRQDRKVQTYEAQLEQYASAAFLQRLRYLFTGRLA